MTHIGAGLPRLDGPAKVTGAARYAADHHLDGELHAVLAGAPVPAGRIIRIGREAARNVPGVVAVLVPGDLPPAANALARAPIPPLATRHLALQDDRILYQGQPAAMVLAETLDSKAKSNVFFL